MSPATATNPSPVPSGQLCSATMSSAQPIAGVGTEHWNTEATATLVQAVRGFTTADYGTTIYAPIFKKKFPTHATQSRSTGAQIQNVSGGALTITATYYYSGGSCAAPGSLQETSPSIADGASHVFLHPAAMADGCLASAKFTASGNIVGVVNESFLSPVPPVGTQSSTAYNTLPGTSATTRVVAPLYKEKFGGKSTGLQVQNVGASTANVYIEFRSGANLYTTVTVQIPAGSAYSWFQVSGQAIWVGTAMPVGTNAAATVVSDQPVLANAVESTFPSCFGGSTCYDRLNYEGFNVAP